MCEQVISRDTIKRQAQRAADAGIPSSQNPYTPGTEFNKRWLGAYVARKVSNLRARRAKLG